MQFGWPRKQKPPIGTPLDRSSELVNGLVWFAPCWESGGSVIADVIAGVNLETSGSPAWVPGSRPSTASQLSFPGTQYASATIPQNLKIGPPVTMVLGYRRIGSATSNALIFSLLLNNTGSAAYGAYGIQGSATTLNVWTSSAFSTFNASSAVLTPTLGVDYVIVAVFYPTTYTVYSYPLSGNPTPTVASGSWGLTSAPGFTSTAIMGFGSLPTYSRNSEANVFCAGFYNRALSAGEAAAWGQNPWQIFTPAQGVAALLQPTPGFNVSPSSIYASNPSGQTVTLSGSFADWTSGTTFTATGLAGSTKASQTVTPPESATITVDTGATLGPITISDGTYQNTVQVVAPTFAISPAAIPANHSGHITLTLTGTGTSWSSNTFALSGVSGATKISQTINSATSTTLVITTGAGTGTLTVSDGTYTAPVAVDAPTFSLSTAGAHYNATQAGIVATGSAGSLWESETASTLFSTPGTYGDSISSIVVTSNTSATFTLNPGTATESLVITEGPTGATLTYPIVGPGSLRVRGPWTVSTPNTSLLAGQTEASYSFFIKFNEGFSSANESLLACGNTIIFTSSIGDDISYFLYDSVGGAWINHQGVFIPGNTYFFAVTGNSGTPQQTLYINGLAVSTNTDSHTTSTGTRQLVLGWPGTGTVDYEISNLAIWNGYAISPTEVLELMNGTITPLGTSTPATSWWQFAGTVGNAPTTSDVGFRDIGSGGNNFTTFSTTPTQSIAQYSGPLSYSPPILAATRVTKEGNLATVAVTNNAVAWATVAGTVSVGAGSASLTSSARQTGWIGQQLQIAGDSSNTTYTITNGYATSWTISPVYGGSTNASGATAQLSTNGPTYITSINSGPTVQVQFGGSGSYETVKTWGPIWNPINQSYSFALWQLVCGPVASIVIQNAGSGYSASPSASASGGGGSGLTLGTPIVSGGVTSYTVSGGGSGFANATATVSGGVVTGITLVSGGANYNGYPVTVTITGGGGTGATATATAYGPISSVTVTSGGSGYTGTPTVTFSGGGGPSLNVAGPTISITGTLTNGLTTVTGITSTAGIVPGMTVTGVGNTTLYNTVAAVVSTTAITLSLPATISGATALSVFGKQALGIVEVAGGAVTGVIPFVAGTGYASAPTVSVSGGGLITSPTITAHVTNVIADVPVTNPGSGYTSQPTISITDADGTGATAVALMAGVQPTDLVRYSAAQNWIACAQGSAAAATNAVVPNYSGQLEPGVGGVYDFGLPASKRTTTVGLNVTGNGEYAPESFQMNANWMLRAASGTANVAKIVESTPDGRPITIDATAASPLAFDIYGSSNPYIGGTEWFPTTIATGVDGDCWTFMADELDPSSPTMFQMVGSGCVVTPINDQTAGLPTTAGTSTTGVNGFTLTSGGSGYTDVPTVTITGGGGTGATAYAKINANGQVIWVNLTACGVGYTSTPTVVFSGGGGTGAAGTVTIGSVISGQAWQFSVARTGIDSNFCNVIIWKTTGGNYPYTLTNERLFSPIQSAATWPSLPIQTLSYGIEEGMLNWLTTPTPKYAQVMRFLGTVSVQGGGFNNIVDPCDLSDARDFTWQTLGNIPTSGSTQPVVLSQNPTASRSFSITGVRTYCISQTCIASVAVTAAGTGYSGTVPITFSYGPATANATVVNGVATGVTVTSGGSGYTSTPTASIGGAATFTVTLSGQSVASVAVVGGGSGYTSTIPVTITDADGTGAVATATVSATGTITGVSVTVGGSGYVSPTMSFAAGGGTGATATATIGFPNDAVAGVAITNGGSRYSLGPVVTISGGNGLLAAAVATISGGAITAITVTNGGMFYTGTPTITITGGGGSGATATATVSAGVVTAITVTNEGTGYSAGLVVSFSGGGGSGAAAVPTLSAGVITAITMTNVGSGYTGTPTVVFSGGGGSSAAGTAVMWDVTWSSPYVYLSNPGTGGSTAVSASEGWPGFYTTGTLPSTTAPAGPYQVSPQSQAAINWTTLGSDTNQCVAEFVTSAPHCLKSGQNISIAGGSNFNVSTGLTSTITMGAGVTYIWVTGPYTFVTTVGGPSVCDGTGGSLPGAINNVAGQWAVDLTGSIAVPYTDQPYEGCVQVAAALPGCDYWAQVPASATDVCVQGIAARIRDNFPKGRKVYVEYTNEHWNFSNYNKIVLGVFGQLGVWTNGPTVNPDYIFAARSAQVHEIFYNTFQQADVNGNTNRGSEIVRVFGGLYGGPGITANMVNYCNSFSPPIQMDAVAVAPYQGITQDLVTPGTAATVSVAGSTGNLPAGTYYVYYTWIDPASGVETSVGKSQATFTITSGQIPTVTIPALDIAASGGGQGPWWTAASANIYLTAVGGAPGTETLYATNVTTTTYGISSDTWYSNTTSPPSQNLVPSPTAAGALLATHWPTSIGYLQPNPVSRAVISEFIRYCYAYGDTITIGIAMQQALFTYAGSTAPALLGYEGGTQNIIPAGIETAPNPDTNWLRSALVADQYYDPSMYDCEIAFYESIQQAGESLINVFDIAGQFVLTGEYDGIAAYVWPVAVWSNQPFGKGDGSTASNGLAMTNQFWSNTQMSPHGSDASVRLKAWNDWADSANPYAIPGDVWVTPSNALTNVSPRGVIVVQFDEPMLGSTITGSTFTLRLGATFVSGEVAYNPITWAATFTPSGILKSQAVYTVQLTTGVTNSNGVALSNPITWSFATSPATVGASLGWFPGLSNPTSRRY